MSITLAEFKAAIDALLAYQAGKTDWGATMDGALVAIRDMMEAVDQGKAPAVHSHGAGGEVVGIGLSTDRPQVIDGFLYYETDTGLFQILNADGTVRTSLVRASDAAILTTGVDYLSSTQVRIPIGKVEINGVVYEVTADIDLTPPLTANTRIYVYVQAPSGADISSGEISFSTEIPTKDTAKGGWYDTTGEKRCIGYFRITSTSQIGPWRECGGIYIYDEPYNILATSASATTPTLLGTSTPFPNIPVIISGTVTNDSSNIKNALYIWNGDSDFSTVWGGYAIAEAYSDTVAEVIRSAGTAMAITNSSGQIIYYTELSASCSMSVRGFLLPPGLRRTN